MKKYVITSGGISEKIDNVRKISNSSSGKLGMTIANHLLESKSDITIYYVCSKNALRPNNTRVKIIEVAGTLDLKDKVESLLKNEKIDYFIHTMAVADYMVDYVTTVDKMKKSFLNNSDMEVIKDTKISSYENNLVLVLKPTPKIISLIKKESPLTYLVGFKLLDGVSKKELIDVATRLRDKNRCDLVVANDLEDIRNKEHKAYIIDKEDKIVEASDKEDIAKKLVRMMDNER
ncbi:dNA/pantothenate metabolism flavoprotein domain protein [Coprobacillus sp. CAG:605]|nr:dNA/pantothenate metabolism flavoprotein domain protein [Coprobacillus sp. CAG:605]